jgi:hypothetical protein
MKLQDIEEAIKDFESRNPTANNVQELANLYTVRNNLANSCSNQVEKELHDILPQYSKYCEIKQKYQLHQLTEEAVISSLNKVCVEFKEFINTLYSCTDFYKERKIILQSIEDLYTKLNTKEDSL